jgi:hypothetical protein
MKTRQTLAIFSVFVGSAAVGYADCGGVYQPSVTITLSVPAAPSGQPGTDHSEACVQSGGTLVWIPGPPPSDKWEVKFSPAAPIAQADVTGDADDDQVQYPVTGVAGTYQYTLTVNGSAALSASVVVGPAQKAGAVAGNARLSPPVPCSLGAGTTDPVSITFYIDSQGAHLDRSSVCIAKSNSLTWVAGKGVASWSIRFRSGTPCADQCPQKGWSSGTGTVWTKVTNCNKNSSCSAAPYTYAYKVKLKGLNGKPYTIDPDIIVDPGTRRGQTRAK